MTNAAMKLLYFVSTTRLKNGTAAARMVRGQDPIRRRLRRKVRLPKNGLAHRIPDAPACSGLADSYSLNEGCYANHTYGDDLQ
jgi:hypothetical protein